MSETVDVSAWLELQLGVSALRRVTRETLKQVLADDPEHLEELMAQVPSEDVDEGP